MFENILQAKLKICEYGKNNKQVTITLSLINSNKGWVIKTPCVFYFRSVKFQYVKETRMILIAFWCWWKFPVLASQHKKQSNKSLSRFVHNFKNTDSDLKVHALYYANELLVLAFQKLFQTCQTSRNNKKLCKKGLWLWLFFRKLRN